MDYGYIGEIRLFGGNFAPLNWAFCDGSLIYISENEAMYSILGTTYGGDGRTTFALPDLRGRTVIGQGQGIGLTNRTLGEKKGTFFNTLTVDALPPHGHALTVSDNNVSIPTSLTVASENAPDGAYLTQQPSTVYSSSSEANQYYGNGDAKVNPTISVGNTGGQSQIGNVQPFLGMNYIICTIGIYPTRN